MKKMIMFLCDHGSVIFLKAKPRINVFLGGEKNDEKKNFY